jgi:hypothetical protein
MRATCPVYLILLILTTLIIFEGKVAPVLPLTEHHAMKVYWGVEVQLHPFLDPGTRRR